MKKTAYGNCSHPTVSSSVSAAVRVPEYLEKGSLLPAQMLRIMRVLSFFLFAASMSASASTDAQSLTLSGKNMHLNQVFRAIKKQTGYVVFSSEHIRAATRPVSVEINNMPLKEALDLVFKSQPLAYVIKGKTIFLSRKPEPANNAGKPVLREVNDLLPISGVILSAEGTPLAGASVRIKGSNKGVVSDAQGKFSLDANPGDVLEITYTGYEGKTVKVSASENIVITLLPREKDLEEVVVNKGYYTERKRVTTSNVATVTSAEIDRQPVTNPLQALQGRMPGVIVSQTNGVAGSRINVQVRGQNFVGTGRSEPLYIIDGVPFPSVSTNRAVPNPSSLVVPMDGAYGQSSPMNSISPNDIESIDILKDADATAIYGSRGANGVVLITTKKGKTGKTSFNANIRTGIAKVGHMVDLLSTEEYVKLRTIAFENAGTSPSATLGPDLLNWSQTETTDFQKMLIGNTAKTTDINAAISGGDSKNRYILSGTWHDETTVFPGDQGYKRVSILANNEHTSLDNKFNLNTSIQYSSDKNNVTYGDLTASAYALPPNFPLYNADGSLNWALDKVNPMADQLRTFNNNSTNLIGNLQMRYTIIAGLDVKVNAGYNKLTTDQVAILPGKAYLPTNNIKSSSRFTNSYAESFIVEPQLSYTRSIGNGRLNVLAGGSWQSTDNRMPFYLFASDYSSDDLLNDPAAAGTRSVYTSSSQYKYMSVFGRATYNWREKYVVNTTFRRDGSSRFGPNNRFGNFGSVGAAWIFSEENFGRSMPWLSFGKLRGSYGLAGSDQIRDFAYLSLYTTSTAYGGSNTLIPNLSSGLPNLNFQWEETRKLEAAVDLGFLQDKIVLNVAWFRNRSDNQLVSFPLSPQTGATSYQANMPALVQNTGWEFSLSTINLRKKDLKFTSALNLTIPSNKLIAYPDLVNSAYANTYVEGYSLNSVFLYRYIGVNETTRLPEIEDVNKDGVYTAGISNNGKGDYIYAGNTYPKYYGGLNNSLSYKNFQFDVFFQFSRQMGRSIVAGNAYPPGLFFNSSRDAVYEYLGPQENWEGNPAITNQFAAAYTAYSRWTSSDASLVDASFIRLKNVNLSYSLPEALTKKIHLQRVRFYVQGQNLFTITSYKGYDPESGGVALPPLRALTGGLQITL